MITTKTSRVHVGVKMTALGVLTAIAIATPFVLVRDADAEGTAPAKAPGKYYGANSCEGSSCHSKPLDKPRSNPPFLTELTQWALIDEGSGQAYDRHSVAFKRLKDKVIGQTIMSAPMMAELNKIEGTKDKAETSERCLTCHGVAVHDYGDATGGVAVGLHKELQGGKFRPDDGVSCDGCHGPAEKWLKPHDKPEWAQKKWKELGGKSGGSLALYNQFGIYFSKDLELWANQCIRCHLAIDSNLIDAGHPDLVPFELFGHNQQVPHWRPYSTAKEEDDLPQAGPLHAAYVWQTGQAGAFHSAAWQLGQRALRKGLNKGKDDTHAQRVQEGYDRAYGHYIVFRHALKKIDEAAAKVVDAEMEALAKEVKAKNYAAIGAAAEKLTAALKPMTGKAAAKKLTLDDVKGYMKEIINDPAAVESPRTAEQLAKALYTLDYAHIVATKGLDATLADPPTDPIMIAVYKMFESFDPANADFKAAVEKVKGALK